MQNITHSKSASSDTRRTPSPAIWNSCPWLDMVVGTVDGTCFHDDFLVADDEDGNDSSYERYIDTSDTIRVLAADTTATATGSRGGVLRLSIAATDNNSPTIQWGSGNGAGSILLGNTSGAEVKTWFECRIRKSSIADDVSGLFVGFGGVNMAANNGTLEDDTGVLVDSISAFGFRVKHVNSGTTGQNALVDVVYQDSANTAETVLITSAATMVASTWMKLGFLYDPSEISAKKIKFFVNNVEASTYLTTTAMDTSTFPENDAMNFVLCAKAGAGTASTVDIDWWRVAQQYS